jgi:FlgN protein
VDPSSLTDQLLDHLRDEEQLLKSAREGVMNLYSALRKGDLRQVQAVLPYSERVAELLQNQGGKREEAARRLALAVGLTDCPSLATLAERVPPAKSEELLSFRTRLRDVASQVEHFRSANANLLDRLRSYFGDVLADFTVQEVTPRYGPTGNRICAPVAATATAIAASG